MIEISEASWSTDAVDLPEDTRRALETDGRTELLKVLGHDDPPRVIRCASTGCTYPRADADHPLERVTSMSSFLPSPDR
jgi:hypothetical protein